MINSNEATSPEIELIAREHAFEQLINSFGENKDSGNGFIEYDLAYPKELFLKYLTEKKNFLLHGSGENVDILEPRQANDAHKESGNKKAVYAVTDSVLPIFYAIQDRKKINGRIVSARTEEDGEVSHQFSLPKSAIEQYPYRNGVIYILPKDGFTLENGEWASLKPVKPYAKIIITPEDFPYINAVTSSD